MNMITKRKIVVAKGDGIGPEIMDSVLEILVAADAQLEFEHIELGEKLYQRGYSSGISEKTWETIHQNKIILKAPITTPQGKGYKSLNVTFRKTLGLFANVRPVISLQPFIPSSSKPMDMVIVRENEEDLYAGIEYRASTSSYLCHKLISQAGCEKIIRYAFEYARINHRQQVTCIVKDNIMKITDGLFHNIFHTVAKEYDDILKTNSYIVDIGAAKIATRPELFDVVVTLNLYGDIISDIAAEASGSVGLAGSANIGQNYAMFEAVHGSAPDIAGQNIANPSGLLNAAAMMLNHIGQQRTAALIQNAWLKSIEDGFHTADIFNHQSKTKVTTAEFTQVVISNLGKKPSVFKAIESSITEPIRIIVPHTQDVAPKKECVGFDVYLHEHHLTLVELVKIFENYAGCVLDNISQRGLLVWSNTQHTSPNDDSGMMRLRFRGEKCEGRICDLLALLEQNNLCISSLQTLYQYDEVDGFSKAQGE